MRISLVHILTKIGEHRLLWLRDMTSQVAGGEAIFEEKCVFFSLFWAKKYKMWTKRGNFFNYFTFLMFSKKNFQFSAFPVKCQVLQLVGIILSACILISSLGQITANHRWRIMLA